jgi:hypothetical protein
MKTLSILTAAAGILLAISGPSLAASRTQAQTDARASYARDNSDNAVTYSPYLTDERNPAVNVQRRNADGVFGFERNFYYGQGPVGTIRNDW